MTTVGDLIHMLEDFDEDLEVRLAMQPSWPMEYTISTLVCRNLGDLTEREREEVEEALKYEQADGDLSHDPAQVAERRAELSKELGSGNKDEDVVFIAEGTQLGYLPAIIAEELGWR